MPISNTQLGYRSLVDVERLQEKVRIEALEKLGFAQMLNEDTGTAIGKNNGDTVVYTYYPQLAVDASPVDETDELPRQAVVPVRGSYTVQEYGQAIPLTGKLKELSMVDNEEIYVSLLADHMQKKENLLAYNLAKTTSWKYVYLAAGNNFTTNGTPSGTQNEDLSFDNLCDLTAEAEDRNIPTFDGENYVVIARGRTINALAKSASVVNAIQNTMPESALNKEIGIIGNARLVKDTQVQVIGISTGSYYEHFLFGADALLKELAVAPELSYETDNHGRFREVAYRWIAGYAKIYSQSAHSKEHIVHITSA